jgi:predicted ATPase
MLHGWARAMAGEAHVTREDAAAAGIAEMRKGLAAYRGTGAIINLPFFLGLLAEVCVVHGYVDEGFALTREALACSGETEERWWDAEILRTRGMLFEQFAASESGAAGGQAEACYREALALAHKQGARALELRAATALGELTLRGHRSEPVLAPLRALVDSFDDGFETPDLRDARNVLSQMS